MLHSDHRKFAYRQDKGKEEMQEFFIQKLPGLEHKGAIRKRIIMDSFEEVVSISIVLLTLNL